MKLAGASTIENLRKALSPKLLALLLAGMVLLGLAPTTALAQCGTLAGTISTWSNGSSGNWSNNGAWSAGTPNSATTSACIADGVSTVNLDISASIDDLGLGSGNTLSFNGNTQLSVLGTQMINNGSIVMNGGGGTNTYLFVDNNVTLSGTGTLTMLQTISGGGGTNIYSNVGADTLTNQSTIQGEGTIGAGTAMSIINSGTIDANSTGGPLTTLLLLNPAATITNTGLLEATNSGVLQLNVSVANGGGNITATGAGATVELTSGLTVTGGTLNAVSGGAVGTVGTAILDGSTGAGAITLNGQYTGFANSETLILGTINNNQNIQLNGGGGTNTYLLLDGSATLKGGGTITMLSPTSGGGNAYLYSNVGAVTLTNVNNTIQGEGLLGDGTSVTLLNQASGIIDANSTGGALNTVLQLQTPAGVTNAGLMEATNVGVLQITGTVVNNAGGNITANGAGAVVQLDGGTTIQGGRLNALSGGTVQTVGSATLDGSTGSGAITLNGQYTGTGNSETFILGTINNNNNIQLNGGGGTNTYLLLNSSVTLQGGGKVTMLSPTSGGGNAYLYSNVGAVTLTNVNNTIQGEGLLGDGTSMTLLNQASGIVNANSTGGALNTVLQLQTPAGVTNTGLMEATNAGVLQITATVVNNAGGNITASGANAVVQLDGSTTIQGGKLNNNGGTIQTVGTATLDGSTHGALTLNGQYTGIGNSQTSIFGTFNNNNNIQLNGGAGTNTYLFLVGNTTLQGGGTVSMLSPTSGGGNAYFYENGGPYTLTNVNNTIQGEGQFGQGTALTLLNQAGGVVNANSTGGTLNTVLQVQLAGTGGNPGTVNQGLMEATNAGVLEFSNYVVNNAGGNISANGGTVQFDNGVTLQGGTLNNNSGTAQVVGFATLDGTTQGALTLNGTLTLTGNSQTSIFGTFNNNGNILMNGGGGTNTYLFLVGNVTLQGNGSGLVTMNNTVSGGGNTYFYENGGPYTLTNVNNTIQGAGLIGQGTAMSLDNQAAGTILANTPGQTLDMNLAGSITNNGTFQVDANSVLFVHGGGNFTNFSGNTLTGGTYNVYGPSTLQINQIGTGGGEIVNNAATILLDSAGSNFFDASGSDTLSNFTNNTSAGSFTIQSGRNFTSPASFNNAGVVKVGSGSTFTVGGGGNYNQSGGSTQLNGSMVASGTHVNINGGVLFGNGGAITGNVTMAGTIAPAATINGSNVPLTAGQLNITGNYTQTAAGIFNLGIGGLTAGTTFGFVGITGNALIDGTLNVNLLNSYFPSVGDTFTFLTTGGAVSGFFSTVNGLNIGNGEILSVVYGANFIEIATNFSSTTDNWLGGTGVWSNGPQWSIGVPQPAYDTFIYSGGNDLVTLNVGSSTVNSLTVGGATNGFTSELTDGGVAQNLTVTNGLTVGQQGVLAFSGNGSTIAAATVSNSGAVTIGSGVTLNLTNQPGGVTSVAAGANWTIGGNFAVGGVANTGFANLSSVSGAVNFQNGASQTISPALTIASGGSVDVSNGTTLNTSAGVNNSGVLTTGDLGTGGNTLTINGTLTNDNYFAMFGFGTGDKATIGTLINNAGGVVDVEDGSTLTVTGNVTNNAGGPQGIYTSFSGTGGNTININGNLTNNGMFALESTGDKVTIGGNVTNNGGALFAQTGGSTAVFTGTLNNSGQVDLENGSSLTVHGVTNNSGILSTSGFGGTGGNTMSFTALLTNTSGAQININGNGDTLKASGGLTNAGAITVKNGSTIDPPNFNNLGTLNIDGTSTFVVGTGTTSSLGYVQLANGTLGEMISSSAFGQASVIGSASLNGTLDILLQGGFNPAIGSTYDIILFTPGGLSGTFATIQNIVFNGGTEIWQIAYDNTNGDVSLTAAMNNQTTPEPGTFLLLGSGLLGIAYSARRRWLK